MQCNEVRTDESPPADIASSNPSVGKKGSEAGWCSPLFLSGMPKAIYSL